MFSDDQPISPQETKGSDEPKAEPPAGKSEQGLTPHATPPAAKPASKRGFRRMVLLAILLGGWAAAAYLYFQPRRSNPVLDPPEAGKVFAQGGHEGMKMGQPPSEKGEKKVLYWQDPMHPVYKSDKPGKAPDCGMDLVPIYEGGGPAAENLPEGAFNITPTKQQLIGVQYGNVAYEPVSKTLRTVGRLMYDETKITRIHTKIEGWIDKVFVDFTGKLVQKDQPLITLYSPQLVSTQQEFIIAKKAKDYLGDNAIKEISSSALSLYDSSRERLRLWDISEEQIKEIEQHGTPTKNLTLYAPSDGFVLARNAYPKQRVTPETELYSIADLSTVWVLADVYEFEAPQIRLGQTATMALAYFPGRSFKGNVTYIYPQLDNTTRTLKVRVEFPNPDFALKPDMYANVELKIDYGRQIVVPQEAVLDSGSEQLVFVVLDNGYFEPRKVQLGAKLDNKVVVLAGLKAGERVVTSANFLVDSESKLKSAAGGMGMPGMSHGGGAPQEGKKEQSLPPAKAEDHSQHQPGGQVPSQSTQPKPEDHSQHQPSTPSQAKPEDHSQHQQPDATPGHQGHLSKPERRILYWYDPMHPAYRSNEPGKAPDCGMELVPKYADDKN